MQLGLGTTGLGRGDDDSLDWGGSRGGGQVLGTDGTWG